MLTCWRSFKLLQILDWLDGLQSVEIGSLQFLAVLGLELTSFLGLTLNFVFEILRDIVVRLGLIVKILAFLVLLVGTK